MNKKNRRRNGFIRTSLLVVLGLTLLAPALSAKERRGANIVVTKNDGTIVRGELLAVMGEDLIIMDESTLGGITAGLADIQDIKVVKKSKIPIGIGIGFLSGAAVGATAAAIDYSEPKPVEFWSNPPSNFPYPKGLVVLGAGLALGVLGALAGGVIAGAGDKRNFTIEDMSPEKIDKTISRLRKLARDQG
jgi:hypothetical protein